MSANVQEIGAILALIDAHPERWNQDDYGKPTDCGTALCVGGHALVRGGFKTEPHSRISGSLQFLAPGGQVVDPAMEAQDVLGLTAPQADTLFAGFNTREDLQAIFEQIERDPEGVDTETLDALYEAAEDAM